MIPDPFSALDIVVPGDKALSEDMDFTAYAESFDPALIKEREGERAARFNVRPMRATFMSEEIHAEPSESKQRSLAFRACCHRVVLGDGTVLEVDRKKLRDGRYGARIAPAEWWDQVCDAVGIHHAYSAAVFGILRSSIPKAAKSPLG
jgi:hypothetical protein